MRAANARLRSRAFSFSAPDTQLQTIFEDFRRHFALALSPSQRAHRTQLGIVECLNEAWKQKRVRKAEAFDLRAEAS